MLPRVHISSRVRRDAGLGPLLNFRGIGVGSRFFASNHVLVSFQFVSFPLTNSSTFEHRRCMDVYVFFTVNCVFYA